MQSIVEHWDHMYLVDPGQYVDRYIGQDMSIDRCCPIVALHVALHVDHSADTAFCILVTGA